MTDKQEKNPFISNPQGQQQELPIDHQQTDHIFTLTCHKKAEERHFIRDRPYLGSVGVGSNQYKAKSLPPIDMNELAINKKELKFKAHIFDELHRKMAIDQMTDPILLSQKVKLPIKEIQALCKADLKRISSFMLMQAITQFGYDIHVCMRPKIGYQPGEVIFEN
ncbi:MAG: hypothetical protein RIQ84_173 [Pseudomonadota bacterium]|jgi:hypothetical protein